MTEISDAADRLRRFIKAEHGMRDRVLKEPRRSKAMAETQQAAADLLVLEAAAQVEHTEQGDMFSRRVGMDTDTGGHR